MPKLAANLSMMFTEFSFLSRFSAAAGAGFHGVEFLFPYDYEAAQLRDALRRNDLKQVLFNAPPGDWDAGDRGAACLADRRGEFEHGLGVAIAYARALDCPRIHVMAGVPAPDADPENTMAAYCDALRFACAQAAKAELEILIEPLNPRDMPGYLLNSSAMALDVMARVGAANLKLQYDIYHMQIVEGDLAATIKANLTRIGHMQLADTPGRHEPGTGEINYAFLLGFIDRLGYDGWIGCEYRPAGDTVAGLTWAAPYLDVTGDDEENGNGEA